MRESVGAPYWNPAGLAGTSGYELSLLYVPLWLKGEYAAVNYGHPLPDAFALTRNTTLGLGYYRIKSGLAEQTDILKRSVGTFSDCWDMISLTYARKISESVNWGFNYKILNRNFFGYQNRLYGADTGLQSNYKLPGGDTLKFSVVLQNLFFNKMQNRISEKIAPNVKLRIGYGAWDDKLNFIFDIDQFLSKSSADPRLYFGCEADILNLLSLRAGINYKQSALGMGINLFNLKLDYAYIFHDLGNMHRLGVDFSFGKKYDREIMAIKEAKEKVELKTENLERTDRIYRNLITKAMEIFMEGDYPEAREKFMEIAAMDPLNKKTRESIEDILDKIDSIILEQKIEEAEKHYKEAYLHFKNNSFDKVAEEIDKALKLRPDLKKAKVLKLRNMGFQSLVADKLNEGKQYLEQALELDPDNEGIKKNLKKLRKYRKTKEGQ